MKILITGAGGFIGDSLSQLLSNYNSEDEILSLVRSKNHVMFDKPKNMEMIKVDLLSDNLKKKLPQNIDTIIHLAANSNTFLTSRESRKQFSDNINLTFNILDYAEKAAPSKLIFSSSVYVYSGGNKTPFLEIASVAPSESLGASKLASEKLLKAYSISNSIDVMSLRLFTVYGPNSRDNQFIPEAIKKIRSKNNPAVFGNPFVKRDFVYIDDVIEAFRLAVIKDLVGQFKIFNIGSGKSYSIEDIVNMIRAAINPFKEIEFSKNNERDHSVDTDHLAEITMAKEHLNWSPRIGIHEGLQITIDNIKEKYQ